MPSTYELFMQEMYQSLGTKTPSKMQVVQYYMNILNSYVPSEVSFEAMAQIVKDEQSQIDPTLTFEEAAEAINAVMQKRNVQFAFLTAMNNDLQAQYHQMIEPLQSIIFEDRGTFGGDEQLALEIASLYGTIGVTNFGYLDRVKKGFIKELDVAGKTTEVTTTFMDDIFSAVIAAAEARVAHKRDQGHDQEPQVDVFSSAKNAKDEYYDWVSAFRFNDADPAKFLKSFQELHPDGVAVRVQESGIHYLSDGDSFESAKLYAGSLLQNQYLEVDYMAKRMDKVRVNARTDLPDWEGDTIYAFVPVSSMLLTDTEQFDEVDQLQPVTIGSKVYAAYRLWWD